MVVAAGSMALNVILLVAIYLLHQRVQTLEQLLAETRCTARYVNWAWASENAAPFIHA
jgi:hypothetical protein